MEPSCIVVAACCGAGFEQVIERIQAPNYGRIKAENASLQKQLLQSAWRMLRGLAQDMQVTTMEQSCLVLNCPMIWSRCLYVSGSLKAVDREVLGASWCTLLAH